VSTDHFALKLGLWETRLGLQRKKIVSEREDLFSWTKSRLCGRVAFGSIVENRAKRVSRLAKPQNAHWRFIAHPHSDEVPTDENVWSAARLQGETWPRRQVCANVFGLQLESVSPGHDEMRACLSL